MVEPALSFGSMTQPPEALADERWSGPFLLSFLSDTFLQGIASASRVVVASSDQLKWVGTPSCPLLQQNVLGSPRQNGRGTR